MRIKLNKNIPPYKEGRELNIDCDSSGIPIEKFWRDRLRDSKRDNCLTVIEEKDSVKNAKPKKED